MQTSLSQSALRARKVVFSVRHRYAGALRDRLAPSIEHERLGYLSISHLIDVGANRGQFSLMARALWPTVTIDAFEPLPVARSVCERWIAGSSASVFPFALSDADGTAEFFVSNADDSSSLNPIGGAQNEFFPGTELSHKVTVETRRADSVYELRAFARPALLKIDVQGHELSTLRGAEILLASIDYVYVECSYIELYEGQALAGEVISFLDERQFVLRGVFNTSYSKSGAALQSDFLFERSG